jgi:Tfp pilus tip-associated adhesin PilY1
MQGCQAAALSKTIIELTRNSGLGSVVGKRVRNQSRALFLDINPVIWKNVLEMARQSRESYLPCDS